MRIREVWFPGFTGRNTDGLDELPLGKFLREIRLMEPHHLYRARGVGNDRFTHRDFPFPRPSCIKFADGAVNGNRLSCNEPRYCGFTPSAVIADGEMIQKVADREDAELLETAQLGR